VITRFDVMEKVWGATRQAPGTMQSNSAGTTAENEDIAFDFTYVKYDTPMGSFRVGAMPGGTWGTVFGDYLEPRYRLLYFSPSYSGFQWLGIIEKNAENSYWVNNSAQDQSDVDTNTYYLAAIYTAKSWSAGLLYAYGISGANRTEATAGSYKSKLHYVYPYFVASIGPLKMQAEVNWTVGKYEYDNVTRDDDDVDSLAGWLDATATFGPVYVGGTFAYARGDSDTGDKKIYGARTGGIDWSPTLIMWNEDRIRWYGAIKSSAVGANDGFGATNGMSNAFLYQVRVGVKPIDKLDVCFSATYAERDKSPVGYDDELGYEFDLTGTYKITNNLSYMLGVGYLVTGDYFKGSTNAETENDYMVINKLTVTF